MGAMCTPKPAPEPVKSVKNDSQPKIIMETTEPVVEEDKTRESRPITKEVHSESSLKLESGLLHSSKINTMEQSGTKVEEDVKTGMPMILLNSVEIDPLVD